MRRRIKKTTKNQEKASRKKRFFQEINGSLQRHDLIQIPRGEIVRYSGRSNLEDTSGDITIDYYLDDAINKGAVDYEKLRRLPEYVTLDNKKYKIVYKKVDRQVFALGGE